ncbi:unnamed protein product [Gongylonema pulchrum]|uniref:Mediator complex subunit 15 n=1 Tax=Gongylonema pulchrum TaxID=637853 RepID=A0A183D7H0_9BILA|nr:unnamed protein product [Gongylonema pulchrum]
MELDASSAAGGAGRDNILDEVSFLQVEDEIQMDRVRQSAVKFSLDEFTHLLRRNLMDKRPMLSAADREDVMEAVSETKKHEPSDINCDFLARLRHLAEVLS